MEEENRRRAEELARQRVEEERRRREEEERRREEEERRREEAPGSCERRGAPGAPGEGRAWEEDQRPHVGSLVAEWSLKGALRSGLLSNSGGGLSGAQGLLELHLAEVW